MNAADLERALGDVVDALDGAGIAYALCGGLALAVHGVVRATQDIDVLVAATDIASVVAVLESAGFDLPAGDMQLGPTPVSHRSALRGGDVVPVDILHVTAETASAFESRVRVPWNGRALQVVDRAGLIEMKLIAGRPHDLADIARLRERS
jgi:hypothetical protein